MNLIPAIVRCIVVVLLTGCVTAPAHGEQLGFFFSGRWDVEHPFLSESPGKYRIEEYVPKGQTIESWSELLTLQVFSKCAFRESPMELMDKLKQRMEQRCENVVWNVIEQTPTGVLYEWRIKDCPPQDDQYEIARIIDGQENRWRIAYTSKTVEIPERTRKEWIDRLSAARVRSEP